MVVKNEPGPSEAIATVNLGPDQERLSMMRIQGLNTELGCAFLNIPRATVLCQSPGASLPIGFGYQDR